MLTMDDYYKDLINFSNQNGDYDEDCSLDGDTQRKIRIFENGEVFYEVSRPVYEDTTATVKGIEIKFSVKLFETEWWTSKDSTSKKMYSVY